MYSATFYIYIGMQTILLCGAKLRGVQWDRLFDIYQSEVENIHFAETECYIINHRAELLSTFFPNLFIIISLSL